ncbi:MAG: metallophosphoesterase [Chloroflexota bacterium]
MSSPRRRPLALVLVAGVIVVALVAIAAVLLLDPIPRRPLPTAGAATLPVASPAPLAPGTVRVLAAGDIGRCGSAGAAATGAYLAAVPDATVLALGDLAYDDGTPDQFAQCYDPVWGEVKDGTIAVPGNHDHRTAGLAGYTAELGAAGGDPAAPWRAVDLGAWRIYALDTACEDVGGCGEGSPQLTWLRDDLAANPRACILAIWHRARFSSGPHGSNTDTDPFWRALADAGADVILNAHDHLYERFAPMDADAQPAADGTRAFVVGTGGDELYRAGTPIAGSEALWDRAFGVLELDLGPEGYAWRFQAVLGEPFTDAGTGTCGAPATVPGSSPEAAVAPSPAG